MKKLIYFIALITIFSTRAQTPITSIPFELFGDHIMLKMSIDDSEPLNFVFDTGSGYTVIDNDVAKKLNLKRNKAKIGNTSYKWFLIKHNTIDINHFSMEKNIKVYSTNLNHLEISLGVDIDGIVGYDLLRHHSIYINFDTRIIDIFNLNEAPKKGDPIPFSLHATIPVIKGKVVLNNDEPHDGTFFVMTGAGTTLDFNSPYANQYDVVHKTGKHYSYLVKGLSDYETPHYEGKVLSFEFGNQVIKKIPIGISTATSGIQADKKVSGIIGSQILRMYNMSIDYGSKTIYLEKDHTYDANFKVNCSGIDVQLSKNMKKVLIHQVFEDSPASKAGVKVNDELIKINGKSMGEVNLPEIKKMLKEEGQTVDLVISQGGSEKSISLKLVSLID